jgi:hypothetical protein
LIKQYSVILSDFVRTESIKKKGENMEQVSRSTEYIVHEIKKKFPVEPLVAEVGTLFLPPCPLGPLFSPVSSEKNLFEEFVIYNILAE